MTLATLRLPATASEVIEACRAAGRPGQRLGRRPDRLGRYIVAYAVAGADGAPVVWNVRATASQHYEST